MCVCAGMTGIEGEINRARSGGGRKWVYTVATCRCVCVCVRPLVFKRV